MKKGISLVALVITIIVLIILTGTVILTMTNGNIIGKSKEAVFKSDLTTYQEVFNQEVLKRQLENQGAFNKDSINATNSGTGDTDIRTWIPGITEEWAAKLEISNGKLLFIGENEEETQFASDILGSSAIKNVSVIGSSVDWEIWDPKDGLEIIYKKGLPFSKILESCMNGEKFEKPIVPKGIYTEQEENELQTYITNYVYAYNNIRPIMRENEDLMDSYGEQLGPHLNAVSNWYDGGKVGEKPVLDLNSIDNNATLIQILPTLEESMEFLDITNGFMPRNASVVETILENKPGIAEQCTQTSVTIPNKIRYSDGTIVDVTEVGHRTFDPDYQSSITEVTISEGITTADIKHYINVNTYNLPSTLTRIISNGCDSKLLTLNINQNISQSQLASTAPWGKTSGTLTVNWLDCTKTYVNGVEQ